MLQRTLVVTILSAVLVFTESTVCQGDCQTPKKQPGSCLPVESCPFLKKLAESPNRNSETILYLKKSICGYSGMVPRLCCPLSTAPTLPKPKPPVTPQKPRPPTPAVTPIPLPPRNGNTDQPVDVSLSPRLSMLPLDVCGSADQPKIIGGKPAKVFEYPWMAVLGYHSTGDEEIAFRCGGTIINNRYVLTAAHCVTGLSSTQKLTTVRLGELLIGNETDCSEDVNKKRICAPPVEDYGIEEIISHANFSLARLTDDIALIRLNQPVTYKDHIQPICLPIGREQYKRMESGKMIVAGWGIYEEEIQSPHLLSVSVPLATYASCSESYSRTQIKISSSRQVCAGGKGNADSCTGDSGGPLKAYGEVKVLLADGENIDQRMVQFGIVSFGPRRCASETLPGVYTRVGYYMDWILNNLRP